MIPGPLTRRWRALPSQARLIISVASVLLAMRLILTVATYLTGGAGPSGPGGSTFATSQEGLAATASLYEENDVEVLQLRSRIRDDHLPDGATIVIVDTRLNDKEQAALYEHVSDGGRAIFVGLDSVQSAVVLLGDTELAPAEDVEMPDTPALATGFSSLVDDVEEVTGNNQFLLSDGDLEPFLVDESDNVIGGETKLGDGSVVVLATSTPLQNQYLAEVDNAQFALNLAGDDDRIYFAEGAFGKSGVRAIPDNWRWFFILLGLAGATFVWSKGKRLGPAEVQSQLSETPKRVAYVDALAANISRTKDVHALGDQLAQDIRRTIARRAGTPQATEPNDIRAAAQRLGITGLSDVQLGLRRARTDDELVTVSTSLVRLQQESQWTI